MVKGAKILIKTLYIIYIAMVLFFCFYSFSSSDIDLGKHFLGIRLDRYVHFIMFFPYSFITWLSCRYTVSNPFIRKYAQALTLASGLVFAGMTELFQSWFFSRSGDILDFAADSVSIVTGCIVIAIAGHPIVRFIDSLFTKQA